MCGEYSVFRPVGRSCRGGAGAGAPLRFALPMAYGWWDIDDCLIEMQNETIENGSAQRTENGVELSMTVIPSADGGEPMYLFEARLADEP